MTRFSQVGDTISLIKVYLECSSLLYNTKNQTSNASGWMKAGKADSVFSGPDGSGEIRFSAQEEGIYQLCFRPAAASKNFIATGIMVSVQEKLILMEVNGIQGIATAIPSSKGNIMAACLDVYCSRRNTGLMTLSLIASTLSCELASHNPAQPGPLISGYLTFVPNSNFLMPINDLLLDALFEGPVALNLGTLQVCFRDAGSPTFITTGLSVTIQDRVLRLIVNGIETDDSPKATVPIAPNQAIGYFGYYPGEIGEEISFIFPSGRL